MPVIIDATVALSWLFEDETSDYADRVLDAVASDGAVVPAIWLLEVANGLLSGERRGRLSAAEVDEALDLLSALPLRSIRPAPLPCQPMGWPALVRTD